MKIAILAWGSLISKPGSLAVAADFVPGGPCLRVEFSRVSRGRRLTLVIDEATGAACRTYVALSSLDNLDRALENLWMREGNNSDEVLPQDVRTHGRVGFIDLISDQTSTQAFKRHPKAVEAIKAWATEHAYDAVIWTALANNFCEVGKGGEPFSVEAATRYLQALKPPELDAALGYIRQAPVEVQTPVRDATNARWPETVWKVMQGRTHDLFLANALLPCFVSFFYGCYEFYALGASTDHFVHSYVPLIGSILAGLCMMAFSMSGVRSALIPPRVFALYIFCVLGGVGIASSAWPVFNLWGVAKGAIWTFLGWKMFRRLGKASDLSRTPINLPNLRDHLVSHVGLHRHDLTKLAKDENVIARLGDGF